MLDRLFGNYLVNKGKLLPSQLEMLLTKADQRRYRLGAIAVSEKIISVAQAEEINALQATKDEHFGNLAIEKGYMGEGQVEALLAKQSDPYSVFRDLVLEAQILREEDFSLWLKEFQQENWFTDEEMEILQHGEIAEIVPLFLEEEQKKYSEYFTYALKNIYRLVDCHAFLEKSQSVNRIQGEAVATQRLREGQNLKCALYGKMDALQNVAVRYTREEFIETEEDILDASCELLNCMNGLYASALSTPESYVRLEPPSYRGILPGEEQASWAQLPVRIGKDRIFLAVTDQM